MFCRNVSDDGVLLVFEFLEGFQIIFFSSPLALRPNPGHGLLILEVSRSHTQPRTTVGGTPLDEC